MKKPNTNARVTAASLRKRGAEFGAHTVSYKGERLGGWDTIHDIKEWMDGIDEQEKAGARYFAKLSDDLDSDEVEITRACFEKLEPFNMVEQEILFFHANGRAANSFTIIPWEALSKEELELAA